MSGKPYSFGGWESKMKIETELGGVEVPAYNPNTRG